MDVLIFECSNMKNGETFPVENTGRGQDRSPEFIIKNLSPHAKTLAIILEDIKHPIFKNFTHWLIFNISAREKIDGAIPGGNCFRFGKCKTRNRLWTVSVCRSQTTQGQTAFIPFYNVRS